MSLLWQKLLKVNVSDGNTHSEPYRGNFCFPLKKIKGCTCMGEGPFFSFILPSPLQDWTPWIKRDRVEKKKWRYAWRSGNPFFPNFLLLFGIVIRIQWILCASDPPFLISHVQADSANSCDVSLYTRILVYHAAQQGCLWTPFPKWPDLVSP